MKSSTEKNVLLYLMSCLYSLYENLLVVNVRESFLSQIVAQN